MVLEYRKLDTVTASEFAALPTITEMLRSVGQTRYYFTVLDLKSDYWQIPMSQASKPYMALRTPDGATWSINDPYWNASEFTVSMWA